MLTPGTKRERKNAVNSGHLVPWQRMQAARTNFASHGVYALFDWRGTRGFCINWDIWRYYFSTIFCQILDGNSHQFERDDFKNLVEISFIGFNLCSISEQLTVEPSHNYNFKNWCLRRTNKENKRQKRTIWLSIALNVCSTSVLKSLLPHKLDPY